MQKIMFNEKCGLQQATFDKAKDMTRRVALGDPVEDMNFGFDTKTHQVLICSGNLIVARSMYAVGEVVAVAQRYEDLVNEGYLTEGADMSLHNSPGWNNKMFVKAELMPHHIKIKDIKVEALAGISDEDCLREGICDTGNGYTSYDRGSLPLYREPFYAFKALIDKLNRRGFLESNPIVFVYTYELID